MTTAFITHRDCWQHDMGSHHPESPDRLGAINDRLIAAGLDLYLSYHDAPLAQMEHLLRVHARCHIETIEERVDSLLAIRELQEKYGHIQEVIVQNFRAKYDTLMAQWPEPDRGSLHIDGMISQNDDFIRFDRQLIH